MLGAQTTGLISMKPVRDAEYLKKVRNLPCVICEAFGERQLSPTEAHHCFHGRYSRGKASDLAAIPLCNGHHTGLRDTSKLAVHKRKAEWAAKYGEDHEWIAVTRDEIERVFP